MKAQQRKVVLDQVMVAASKIRAGFKKDAGCYVHQGEGALSLALRLDLIDSATFNLGSGWLWVVMQIRLHGLSASNEADEKQAWEKFCAAMGGL